MNINLFAPINQLGYGIAGLNICKELSKLCDLTLTNIGPIELNHENEVPIIRSALVNAQMLDFEAPCVKIWHQNEMAQFVGKGLRIGFPFFELDQFNEVEKYHLRNLDAIFVCSRWAKDIVLKEIDFNPDKVFIVPLGVDQNIFKPTQEKEQKQKSTIFFNCGKWEIRKGHDVLVEIFSRAFSETDDVELWMMCMNPFLSEQEHTDWVNLYKESPLGDKIKILPRLKSQLEVYNIMSSVDCGVFPSRAEGWNLELLELMSCGKNVIATSYSAHNEFCTANNCHLVPIENLEPAFDGKWFTGEGNWAKIEEKQKEIFISHMKKIHKEKQEGSLKENTLGTETGGTFSWQNTARKVVEYVQLLQEERK